MYRGKETDLHVRHIFLDKKSRQKYQIIVFLVNRYILVTTFPFTLSYYQLFIVKENITILTLVLLIINRVN